MELRGKKIAVVGASSGIGRALSVELARGGAEVLLLARRSEKIEECASALRADGLAARAIAVDTASKLDVARAAAECRAHLGELDGLIYNAGQSHVTMVDRLDSEQTKKLFETNFYGFLYWLEEILPEMRRRQSGFIAATTALCAYRGIPSGAEYAASKGALGNLLDGLQMDLEPRGIRVFQLMPGFVDTPMLAKNNVTAPLTISAERAARIIVRGLRRERSRIEFGRGMAGIYKILRNLPDRVYALVFKSSFVAPRMNFEEMIETIPPLLCPQHQEPLDFDRYWTFGCRQGDCEISTVKDHPHVLDGRRGGTEPEPGERHRRFLPAFSRVLVWALWARASRAVKAFYRQRAGAAAERDALVIGYFAGERGFSDRYLRGISPRGFLGLAPSLAAIRKRAKGLTHMPRRLFYACTASDLNFPRHSLRQILCCGVMNQHDDPEEWLQSMRPFLHPEGELTGTYWLRPQSQRGQRAAHWLAARGKAPQVMSQEEFEALVVRSGYSFRERSTRGNTLLFTIRPGAASDDGSSRALTTA